ncbi:riboflavin transporter 2-like isoform X2 [Alosa alosa]|uniref:riboflavin transporter 2-like isoform X2 n=1 Tax=Alosa alosa TaxID=278164 RepID=UPI0020150CC9|nr:riboflavin transporter 2-like isoform X2 [Alosa alosa]
MSVLTHVLACLFGLGSWVTICGLWVELPLIVPQIPEGWYLPSYLSALIQLANVGPLCVTLAHRLCPGRLNESALIYAVVSLGTVATFLLAFFWRETVEVAGAQRSVALFTLTFLVSAVDCTSSVTFLPFMNRLPPTYLTSYFVGEGLSGLLPALVALAQGVGVMRCVNATTTVRHASVPAGNASWEFDTQAGVTLHSMNVTTQLDSSRFLNGSVTIDAAGAGLVPHYQLANFSAQVFFFFLTAMMLVCLGSFLLLNCLPCVPCEHPASVRKVNRKPKGNRAEEKYMIASAGSKLRSRFGTGRYSWPEVIYIFCVLAWANALTNSVLPSVQSYSCLPYGNVAYHWSATMAAVANPVACFIAMVFPRRSLFLMGILTATGTAIGAYIMGMAVLSPCPLLVGNILEVGAWVLFVLTLSYVKVIIGLILRDEGHSALVWCGAVVQFGSMVGALTMFPLVNVYSLFKSGDPCNTWCL